MNKIIILSSEFMDILINVTGQKLKPDTNKTNFISGTQEFVRFVFNLSDDWKPLKTFAQFQQNGKAYNQYLDASNSVYLPTEITGGTCHIILQGVAGTTVAISESLRITIDNTTIISDAQSTVISKSLYDQLVAEITEFENSIDDIVSAAETATENATNAVQNAATAVASANEALVSANEAVNSANEAAAAANNAAANIDAKIESKIDTSETKSAKVFANALTGNKTGAVVSIVDVSPIEHIIETSLNVQETVTVMRCGKNQFDMENMESGMINATTGALQNEINSSRSTDYIPIMPNTTYTWSGFVGAIRTHFYDVNKTWISSTNTNVNGHFVSPATAYYIKYSKGTTVPVMQTYNIQLEIGSGVTGFEPFKGFTEYTPDTDGTVNNVKSLYPSTILFTQNSGVIISCKYNRDINKAFAALEAAIVNS